MEKINIAEILKGCPSGMELDCAICDNVYFDEVTPYGIRCYIKNDTENNTIYFHKDGSYLPYNKAKCVIFPKGKTTWKGFQRPFKDGDIIFTGVDSMKIGLVNTWISIFEENRNGRVATYVDYCNEGEDFYTYLEDKGLLCMKEDIIQQRFATEEEKQILFDAIKANGYKWVEETKTLEKLVVPKFNVGDTITNGDVISVIKQITKDSYILDIKDCDICFNYVFFKDQDKWKLVPNKFDINTLKPFESRVLVRTGNRKWVAAFYGHYDKDSSLNSYLSYCVVGGLWYEQCIPYEGNEHLLNTTDDCNEFYKNW